VLDARTQDKYSLTGTLEHPVRKIEIVPWKRYILVH